MKALVLLSGGLDSSTCLAVAIDEHGKENICAMSVYYGQKHNKELESARAVAEYYGVRLFEVDLSGVFKLSDSALLLHSGKEIPKGSYSSQLDKAGGEPASTYVPFRNGLFISAAASAALINGCDAIYYGAHLDDCNGGNAAYPDCSAAFSEAIDKAVYEGSGKKVRVLAPFANMDKAEVVKTGIELNVPYELTWSCYEGVGCACGHCATCLDRAEAFEANNIPDPLEDILSRR
jgi:7-cyano-7-deazaguanine synthase